MILNQNVIELTFRKIQRHLTSDPIAAVRKHVIINFVKKNNVRMRIRQRNRGSKESFRRNLMKLHSTTRRL